MAWDLLGQENIDNYHLDHDDRVVYVYMEVLREDKDGNMVEKTDWYPPEEYTSPYYNGPLTRYEPRLKTQSYELGVYPDVSECIFPNC